MKNKEDEAEAYKMGKVRVECSERHGKIGEAEAEPALRREGSSPRGAGGGPQFVLSREVPPL